MLSLPEKSRLSMSNMQTRFPSGSVWTSSLGGGRCFSSPSMVVNVGAVMGTTRGAHSARIASGMLLSAGDPVSQLVCDRLGDGVSPKVTFGLQRKGGSATTEVRAWQREEEGSCGLWGEGEGVAHIGGFGIDPLYKPVARIRVMTKTGSRKTSRRQDCGRLCRAAMERARARAQMAHPLGDAKVGWSGGRSAGGRSGDRSARGVPPQERTSIVRKNQAVIVGRPREEF
jgi:hypothetical protein